MPTSMRAFSTNLRRLAEGLEDHAGRLVEEVTERVHGALVLGTPVKTGFARSNWLVGINDEPDGTVPIRSELDTIKYGQSVVRGRVKGDAEVSIVSNVHYVPLLDAGSSRKAPAGFVLKAVVIGVKVAAEAWFKRGGWKL